MAVCVAYIFKAFSSLFPYSVIVVTIVVAVVVNVVIVVVVAVLVGVIVVLVIAFVVVVVVNVIVVVFFLTVVIIVVVVSGIVVSGAAVVIVVVAPEAVFVVFVVVIVTFPFFLRTDERAVLVVGRPISVSYHSDDEERRSFSLGALAGASCAHARPYCQPIVNLASVRCHPNTSPSDHPLVTVKESDPHRLTRVVLEGMLPGPIRGRAFWPCHGILGRYISLNKRAKIEGDTHYAPRKIAPSRLTRVAVPTFVIGPGFDAFLIQKTNHSF